MSNDPTLGFVEMAAGQQQPEVVLNAATRAVARAGCGQITINFEDDADLVLAADPTAPHLDQWPYRSIVFTDTGGVLTAQRNVTLPDAASAYGGPWAPLFVVANETGRTLTVLPPGGGAGVNVLSRGWAFLYFDGAAVRELASSGAAPSWTPDMELSAAIDAWYDPSDDASITLASGDTEVSALADKGPNGVDLVAGTTGNPAVGSINGLRAIRFTYPYAADSGLYLWRQDTAQDNIPAGVLDSPSYTVCAVLGYDVFTTNAGSGGRTSELIVRGRDGDGFYARRVSCAVNQDPPLSMRYTIPRGGEGTMFATSDFALVGNDNLPFQMGLIVDNDSHSTAVRVKAYQNSWSEADLFHFNLKVTPPMSFEPEVDTSLSIGARLSAFSSGTIRGDGYYGTVGEIIMFNRVLTDAELEKVEGYLAHKWGLTDQLPVSHPYKTTPPSPV